MPKTLYLISNAHIDPVWQWQWEEGAATALSTFRCAADFCEEFDGYVFNHNEALLYRWIEEYEPTLFERIRKLVKAGKWHIMGGWFLQPDCNLPSGEAFVRQMLEGRLYFAEKFGAMPTTAINFDPFGHSRGLVQILKKGGYDSYLFCRPGEDRIHLPEGPFEWVGFDGSTVLAQRSQDGYGSALGKADVRVNATLEHPHFAGDYDLCLWGVGDHGGGASRKDLAILADLKKELEKKDIILLHATPEDFFARVKAEQAELETKGEALPQRVGDLNPWAPGCYTSQIRVKQKYRQLENWLFSAEKMALAAEQMGMAWPKEEFDEVLYDLLTIQFHDSLPGSSIQPVEEMILRKADHALEILSRIRTRAFYTLAHGQRAAAEGEIPLLVYNPHPWAVEGDFHCEMMLWDQNWENNFSMPQVSCNGTALPTQCEKEDSNIPLDWRKRAVFHAVLPPMQMSRFDCTYVRIPEKPACEQGDADVFRYVNKYMTVDIDKTTGTVSRYCVGGTEYLTAGACTLDVVADNADPWGMTVDSFKDRIGSFTLLSAEEATAFRGVDTPTAPVMVIEQGPVRTVVEAVFGWGHSRAVIRYTLSESSPAVELDIRVQWADIHQMLKLRLPAVMTAPALLGQVAYGLDETLPTNGRECVAQRYAALRDGDKALTVLNDCSYAVSCEDSTLWLTLLRSPAYTAHPIDTRRILPQDRYTAHIEQGERLFHYRIEGGKADELLPAAARRADEFNEAPMAISFFPQGNDGCAPSRPLFTLTDDVIQMPAVKHAAQGEGVILRLFNPTDETRSTVVASPLLDHPKPVRLGAFEIVTLRIENGRAVPCDLLEKPL